MTRDAFNAAVRALLLDVASYLDANAAIDRNTASAALAVATFVSGKGAAYDLLYLAAFLTRLCKSAVEEAAFGEGANADRASGVPCWCLYHAVQLATLSGRTVALVAEAATLEQPTWREPMTQSRERLQLDADLRPFASEPQS